MRRQTNDLHSAQDWTQGFFASLLSRNAFAELDPSFGRFRSFLLAAARHFASNERDKNQSVQRGGRLILQSIDYEEGERQLANELTRGAPAEVLFERQWALAILDRVLNRLRQEYNDSDRSLLFDALAEHLSGTATDELLCEVASRLQLSSEAVRVSLHRLRKRYRHLLRDEIGQTTESADDVDDEIRHLFRVLSR